MEEWAQEASAAQVVVCACVAGTVVVSSAASAGPLAYVFAAVVAVALTVMLWTRGSSARSRRIGAGAQWVGLLGTLAMVTSVGVVLFPATLLATIVVLRRQRQPAAEPQSVPL